MRSHCLPAAGRGGPCRAGGVPPRHSPAAAGGWGAGRGSGLPSARRLEAETPRESRPQAPVAQGAAGHGERWVAPGPPRHRDLQGCFQWVRAGQLSAAAACTLRCPSHPSELLLSPHPHLPGAGCAATRLHAPTLPPAPGQGQPSPAQSSPVQCPPLTPLADPLALPQGLEVVGVPPAAAVEEQPARPRGRAVGVAIEEAPARAVLRGQVADVTSEHGAGDESRTLAAAPAPAQQGGSGAVAPPSGRGHAAEAAAREAALFSAGTVAVVSAGAVARE